MPDSLISQGTVETPAVTSRRPRLLSAVGSNLGFLTISAALRGGTGFAVNAYLARALGPALFGVFSFAYALTTIVFRLTAGGFELVATRDIAREPGIARSYTANLVTIRGLILLLTTFALYGYTLLYYEQQVVWVTLFLALHWAFFYCSNVLFATLRAFEQMQYEAFTFVVYSVFIVAANFTAIRLGGSVTVVAAVFAVGTLLQLALTFGIFRRVMHYMPLPAFDWRLWGYVWRVSWPLAVANILYILYTRIDILILSAFTDTQSLGWYNAAYNFVVAAGLVSSIVSTAMLPRLSVAFESDILRFRRLYRNTTLLLLLAGLAVATALTLLAQPLILAIYGVAYEPSVPAFQILTWAILLSYLNTFMNTALTAMNQVKAILYILIVAVVLKTALNFVLVGQIGFYSGSIASVVGELFVTTAMWATIEWQRRRPGHDGALRAPTSAGE